MDSSLIRLLQLVSPTLPVGAYAYSQGLEFAVQSGWITDEETARNWLYGLMQNSMAYLDAPVALRLYDAWLANDQGQVDYWNEFLFACREAKEIQLQEQQIAVAMAKLLCELQIETATRFVRYPRLSVVTTFMLAASHWRINRESAMKGLLWSWLENLTLAAIKLVPLGQTAGQRILFDSNSLIEQCVQTATKLNNDEIGSSLPAQGIATAMHETLYSRLFRS